MTKPSHDEIQAAVKRLYPTGRKLCRCCGWRLVIDFVANWSRKAAGNCNIYLEACCKTCRRLNNRVNGAVPLGSPRPEAVKRKISRTRAATAARYREQESPSIRRCPECSRKQGRSVFKPVSEFRLQLHRLVDGSFTCHPRSWCISCERERSKVYRERERYRNRLTQEERRARQRMYDSRRRRRKLEKNQVDPDPFLEWFGTVRHYLQLSDSQQRAIIRWASGESASANLFAIDEICVRMGHPEIPAILYGDV